MNLKDYENSTYTITAEKLLKIFTCLDLDDNPEIQLDNLITIQTGFMLGSFINQDVKFDFYHDNQFWLTLWILEDDSRVDWAKLEEWL